MKIRNGFVSNSSSSSFVCQICSASKTGFDCSAEELGFVVCENDHTFCESHLTKDKKFTDEDDYYVSSECCPICQYEDMSYSDMRRYFLKTTTVTEDEVFSEIKKVNKRRKKLYDNEYVEYAMKANGTTADDILTKLKELYPNYNSFIKFLREK
jgi:hypothetical protein